MADDPRPPLKGRDLQDTSDPAFAQALELVRFWRDPATKALGPLVGLGAAGFIIIAIGWHIAARTLAVPLQTPALVSGGFGGLALVGLACMISNIHFSRGDAARERREIQDLIVEARALLEVAPEMRKHKTVPTQRRAPRAPRAARISSRS